MGRFSYHPFHQVLEYAFLHLVAVEAVGVLVDIGLQVTNRMVHAPEPGLEQHDAAVQLGEILALLLRLLPDHSEELKLPTGPFAYRMFHMYTSHLLKRK